MKDIKAMTDCLKKGGQSRNATKKIREKPRGARERKKEENLDEAGKEIRVESYI